MNERDPSMVSVYLTLTYLFSTVAVIVIGVLSFLYHLFFFILAGILCFGLVVLVFDFLIRRVTRSTYTDIGATGTIGQDMLGRVTVFEPYDLVGGQKVLPEKKAIPSIPTVAQMLAQDLFDGLTMFFGYQISESNELIPLTGMFNDVRTFAIIGKGGSGKTVRLFFIILQCLLAGGTIYLCDPHMTKSQSITNLLKPLSHWVKFAVTDAKGDIEGQIMAMVAQFKDRMERRVHDQEQDRSPCILVIDEFARMMYHEEYGESCVDVVVSCANQYRDYGGYSIVVMHELVATSSRKVTNLVARLRRSLHAIMIMRVDREYAKYFLTGKQLKSIERLKTGLTYLIDTDGQVHEDVHTPFGKVMDAFTVASKLRELTIEQHPQLNTKYTQELTAPNNQVLIPQVSPSHPGNGHNGHGEEQPLYTDMPPIPLPQANFAPAAEYATMDAMKNNSSAETVLNGLTAAKNAEEDFFTYEGRKDGVRRRKGMTQSEILSEIWQVSTGGSPAYKEALSEYKRIKAELQLE